MQLKYDLEYEHVAYIVGPKGQQMRVGTVLVMEEDAQKLTTSMLVRFDKNLPKALAEQIIKEPRVLNFIKIAKKSTAIITIPELGD